MSYLALRNPTPSAAAPAVRPARHGARHHAGLATRHHPAVAHHAHAGPHTGGAEATPLHLGGAPAVHAAAAGGGSSLVRTLVALLIVAAVIYGVAWVLRRVKGGAVRAKGAGLQQLSTLPLGSGRSLTLVRAGGEVVLLGVAEHGVTAIRTYGPDELAALGLDPATPPAATPVTPAAAGRTAAAGPGALTTPAQRAASLVTRLRRMTVRS